MYVKALSSYGILPKMACRATAAAAAAAVHSRSPNSQDRLVPVVYNMVGNARGVYESRPCEIRWNMPACMGWKKISGLTPLLFSVNQRGTVRMKEIVSQSAAVIVGGGIGQPNHESRPASRHAICSGCSDYPSKWTWLLYTMGFFLAGVRVVFCFVSFFLLPSKKVAFLHRITIFPRRMSDWKCQRCLPPEDHFYGDWSQRIEVV